MAGFMVGECHKHIAVRQVSKLPNNSPGYYLGSCLVVEAKVT
jgi:hypothetical protein